MFEESSARALHEQVIEDRILDVTGARVRVREFIVSERGRRRGFLELTLLSPDGTAREACLVDVRCHDEACALLATAAAAFVASVSFRVSARAVRVD